ncbi:hypothetical protein [Bacteroides pyogenes]|uniref:hypothetical protein n=1 Tax=Bacteroides pyogenes TaxID=310300 RepID=UPI0011C063B6|nr:hypothetical protein [Bacteroides pyogenes]MBB3895220.1 hypothetical protein [Bacteroides pyogenes]
MSLFCESQQEDVCLPHGEPWGSGDLPAMPHPLRLSVRGRLPCDTQTDNTDACPYRLLLRGRFCRNPFGNRRSAGGSDSGTTQRESFPPGKAESIH